jgi:hypothetical protein
MTTHTRQPLEPETGPMVQWEPYESSGGTLRISQTSCCGRYELAGEAGKYFVLRQDGNDGYEETGRECYRKAVDTYAALVMKHREEHAHQGEEPVYDVLLDGVCVVDAS